MMTPESRPVNARVARAHRVVANLLAVLVLLQAVVAGQATFGDWEIELHGWMGNGSFALGVLLLGLAAGAGIGRPSVLAAGALAGALFVQVGLGYAGRTELSAASWHIPLGVTIFGLSIYILTLANQRPSPDPRR